ncbi:MAG: glycosyltransferase [Deltaproteobacteria bacterium]|nr:glycosyltransferase [Deltaproteobacteria bacterium]
MLGKRILHSFEPSFLASEARRIALKLKRKIIRPDARRVVLEPDGEVRGEVLFSYILDPFLLRSGQKVPHWHTHYWESHRMAMSFVELGYRVEAISWTNKKFQPERPYDAVVDVRLNLQRWAPLLGTDAVKIFHIDTSHWSFNNGAQGERLERLRQERGLKIRPVKMVPENRGIEVADCGTVLGNEFTQETYSFAGKPLYRIPISSTVTFPWPEGKSFEAPRRRFLWFGSGGLVHKGLDLVLEAFAGLPDFELVVCGPIRRERDFERAYFRELYETPNIHTEGWVDVAGQRFQEIARSCLGVVYPSCSEGGGGSVISCLHAGLIPVVTREASVDVSEDFGVVLRAATIEEIRRSVRALSERSPAQLEAMARAAWAFARQHHTREGFARAYGRFAARIADGSWRQGVSGPPSEAAP